ADYGAGTAVCAGQRVSVPGDTERSGVELCGSGDAAARAVVGRHAERGARLYGAVAVDGDLSGRRDHADRVGLQLPRRWAPRCAGSAAAEAVSASPIAC